MWLGGIIKTAEHSVTCNTCAFFFIRVQENIKCKKSLRVESRGTKLPQWDMKIDFICEDEAR